MQKNNHTIETSDLSQAKTEYLQMKAPEELRGRVVAEIKQHKTKYGASHKSRMWWIKCVSSTAAVFILTFCVMVNASPAFAETVAGIPGMSGVVKVLTFGHYEYSNNGMDANVDIPKIEGLIDKELEQKINKEFAEYADSIIAEFKAEAEALQSEFPGETVHFGMDSGYQVLTNTEDYLAIDIYLVNMVGSSSTVHKYYTIDKKTQKLLTLNDLFVEGTNYTGILEEYVTNEMKKQNASGEHMYWIDEPEFMPESLVTPESLFYIDPNGQLVICFEKYSVAPGAEGSPTFTIPNDVIADIIK